MTKRILLHAVSYSFSRLGDKNWHTFSPLRVHFMCFVRIIHKKANISNWIDVTVEWIHWRNECVTRPFRINSFRFESRGWNTWPPANTRRITVGLPQLCATKWVSQSLWERAVKVAPYWHKYCSTQKVQYFITREKSRLIGYNYS
jgi:hypothetical protein